MPSTFQFSITFPLGFLILTCTTTTLSQPTATATAPPPPGPTNITKILEKAAQFTVLLHLFHISQLDNQINTQLNNSNQGITVFAPTDTAFSNVKPGLLNSLSDQQKVALVQFHVIPILFLSISQFQTVSNPLRTQAGDNTRYEFPLNITTSGNQVNISTGVNDATVVNTIYTDGSLAVYQVDQVLLPMSLFGPPAPPSPPPPPEYEKKNKKSVADDDSPASRADVASGVRVSQNLRGFIVGPFEAIALIVMLCL